MTADNPGALYRRLTRLHIEGKVPLPEFQRLCQPVQEWKRPELYREIAAILERQDRVDAMVEALDEVSF